MTFKLYILLIFISIRPMMSQDAATVKYSADKGNGSYSNPIIHADYSDPDVVRVGTTYYMTASSFNCVPGLPILRSKDLVNWELIGYALKNLPSTFDQPMHGKGVWAPCIRYHDAKFWIFYGDPDSGLFVVSATDPSGAWSEPHLLKSGKGLIDPSPLWDDDGKMYIVHSWAKSRAGFNGVLTLREVDVKSMTIIGDSINIYYGKDKNPTVEGPKFYKRNGYYYIFAPAGGVKNGWQIALRSKTVTGTYEEKVVLNQGTTIVNGPHQGAWVETPNGESWFIHFQQKGSYGRVVHLQPMAWEDDFPCIGLDHDGDGIGEPVMQYKKPNLKSTNSSSTGIIIDDFNQKLGLMWQSPANTKKEYYSLEAREGYLRLFSSPAVGRNLWHYPNLLLQKLPYESFCATTEIDPLKLNIGDLTGLVVMGKSYSFVGIRRTKNGMKMIKVNCADADKAGDEKIEEEVDIPTDNVSLRVEVKKNSVCAFSFSYSGKPFKRIGSEFRAAEGLWIGAKLGLFTLGGTIKNKLSYSDINYFRIEKVCQ